MENTEEKTEFEKLREELFNRAKNEIRTPEDLKAFADELKEKYSSGYNETGLASAALAIAAAEMSAKVFGLTGFQFGWVMWQFIDNAIISDHDCGMRLMNFNEMLYPQYEDNFEKTITKDTWSRLQKKASETLADRTDFLATRVKNHLESIVDGNIPFGYKLKD